MNRSWIEFLVLTNLVVVTRFADLFITYTYTPDLGLEANPMVSYLKLHWLGFILFTVFLTGSVIGCLYYDMLSKNTVYPVDKYLSFNEFAPRHWFGRRRHPIFFLLAFAKNWDLRIKFIGYAGARLLILIGVVASLSWLGIAWSPGFETTYNFCFPVFPYGLIILGAVSLLYLFLKKEFGIYQSMIKGEQHEKGN